MITGAGGPARSYRNLASSAHGAEIEVKLTCILVSRHQTSIASNSSAGRDRVIALEISQLIRQRRISDF